MSETVHPTPVDLMGLASLCEKAICSSRDLDGLIFIAITPGVANAGRIDQMGGVVGWWPRNAPYQSARDVPAYTRSLDDAASLIPEGHDWILEHVNDGMTIGARVGHNDLDRTSWGETPALALAAGALRARAALSTSPHHQEQSK